jgi:hypothetical protein
MVGVSGPRLSQRDRVLNALRARGGRGVTPVDFLAPGVCDCGPPVTRFAARVNELRSAGHVIVKAGRRDRCDVLVLVREAPAASLPSPALDAAQLFDSHVGAPPPRSPYDAEAV